MPKLRRLSAEEIIDILNQFGFEIISQKGSHIKLRRLGENGKETLTVPNHKQLDLGTCRAIYRQASKYISESDLHDHFYE
ncbi:type II toxin-antitoxin system HicA family toxin [Sphaerospermopsis sp. LEGE 00249]|uniref:type II toxin-antitoxin system HicA family toxin n=1 Tax=Sphaerospermopsis sp. LEGE 00249 TaxID=1380707 RepID=UPI00164DE93D|nr:type II toxin-antitoxin system HicA family toxin [Sphaerospermopsis sp. LEGE 00249]MBC5797279.1 type II toxin-antitoxin system HicA family toxin [Sphaerospermopsis sp. LEGE 00249]